MIFLEKLQSVLPSDRVLEIGPGGTPHARSDVLLELKFEDSKTAEAQRGYAPQLETKKQIVFYDGGRFPFSDKEFDYVICSHVVEHVENVSYFLQEIERVGYKGYIEYPTIYYDYVYNFPEHLNFLFHDGQTLLWMRKEDTAIHAFMPVQSLFYNSLWKRYDTFVSDLSCVMFQGFEWFDEIPWKRVNEITSLVFQNVDAVLPEKKLIDIEPSVKQIMKALKNKASRQIYKYMGINSVG